MVYVHKITNIAEGEIGLIDAFTTLLLYFHVATTIYSYRYYYKFVSLLLYIHLTTAIRLFCYYQYAERRYRY